MNLTDDTSMNITDEQSDERILMAHGGGGELMQRLIREHLVPPLASLANPLCNKAAELTDSAVVPWNAAEVVFTTDSFVVTPLEFPGGDIGRLAVCGTVNDIAVMGAAPVALSLALVLGEGLPVELLSRIMLSITRAADEAGVAIVTGDTKVIERHAGQPPALIINTAGIGRLLCAAPPDANRIRAGDRVIVNGFIADHGLAVMSAREGLKFETPLRSDAAPLNHLIARLADSGIDVRFMRDATRGGVAGVLADVCDATGLSVVIEESQTPVSQPARMAAEMLGLDPLTVANEGKVVIVISESDVMKALELLRTDPLGRNAACMGTITADRPALVELVTRTGGRRVMQRPYGESTPRIC
ncbi:MAG: hydrogenase expression/formation protein HypE [Phycisphaerales bacterium]|nr:hydrogenase expression/formation protein HypE [Phycisphaerales bacterium]